MGSDVVVSGELLPAKAGKIVITREYPDGKITAKLEWADGFWQTEVFASEEALMNAARENGWEVVDSR